MIVSQFKVCTHYADPSRWFWVRVYDSPESLRAVANRWRAWTGGEGAGYDECLGCVQEVIPWIHQFQDPADQDYLDPVFLRWPEDGFAGVIRLCEPHVSGEIIAHECTHAAVTVLRMNRGMRPQLEGMLAPERPVEEDLAYAVGELVDGVHTELRAHGWELS